MGLLNGITEAAKFFMGASDKGKGKKALCIVGGIGTVVGAVVLGWKIWRDYEEEKKENKKENDKRETNQLKEKEKRKTTHLAEEEKRETIRVAEEEKRETARQRAEIRQREKAEKQQQASPGMDEWLQQYRQTIPQRAIQQEEEYTLILPWLTESYDIGLVAPTNCGKTTLMMQVAMDLARGECTHPLAPGCTKIQPVRVLYFALEQSRKDIKRRYGDIENQLPLLTVYDGTTYKTKDILEIIKQEMMTCRGRGIVVIIDNWTKLRRKNGQTGAGCFWNDVEELLMVSSQTVCPLTTIKVFHTKKDYKPGRPVQLEDCEGYGSDLTMMQNILYLTPSYRGKEYPLQGYLKLKDGDESGLNLLHWANTWPNQFEYAGPATANDFGCAAETDTTGKKEATEEITSKPVKKVNRRGPKPHFSIEQAIEWWNEVKSGQSTWKQIMKSTGFKDDAIRKRARPYMPQEGN